MMMLINLLLLILCDQNSKGKNYKLVLRFNKSYEKTSLLKDLKPTKVIKKDHSQNNHIVLTRGELDDIYLGDKALCVIFKNLDLLSKSDKLKDVYIDKVAIYKDNKDPWNKIEFKDKIDSTGYFRGVYTEKFNLYESMFFHPEDIDEETEKKNVLNVKKILYYIGLLKKKPLYKIFKEECKLDLIDLVIFKNLYHFDSVDDVKVCVCRDVECTVCEGIFETKRSLI